MTQPHDPEFPDRFRDFMRTGWRDTPLAVSPRPEAVDHAKRRAELAAALPGQTLVIPSGPARIRANDTDYRYRPGSDHVWLTGELDPEAVLFLYPSPGGHEAVLYTRGRTGRDTDDFFTDRQHGELWIGRRSTLTEKSTQLDITTVDLARLDEALDACAPGSTLVLRGIDPRVDAAIRPTDDGERDRELAHLLSEFRLVKDEWEIAQLQSAIDATVLGFEDAARVLPADRPISERLLEGIFALRARHDGHDVGYSSIVGSGAHATILHWVDNTGTTRPGDLLLMDMGVEGARLYTADVTRVLPVNGTFSEPQRAIYDIVLAAQQAGIDVIAPGVAFDTVHQACMRVLAQGLFDLGILPVSVDEAMERDVIAYRRWSLHGFGHMLGLDVHDCAKARREYYREGALGEGYVLTVEPGLYLQPDDELVPAEFRGIGVRIEDDVQVTADGARILSAGLPRTAADVEQWLAAQRAAGPRLPG